MRSASIHFQNKIMSKVNLDTTWSQFWVFSPHFFQFNSHHYNFIYPCKGHYYICSSEIWIQTDHYRLNIAFFSTFKRDDGMIKVKGKPCTVFLPALSHFISRYHPPGSFTDPSAEGLSRERARERDRSRPHERRHHSSAGEKQRYYSCERYGSREQCHTKSAGPSRSTSPGEGQDICLLKQVGYLPYVA